MTFIFSLRSLQTDEKMLADDLQPLFLRLPKALFVDLEGGKCKDVASAVTCVEQHSVHYCRCRWCGTQWQAHGVVTG